MYKSESREVIIVMRGCRLGVFLYVANSVGLIKVRDIHRNVDVVKWR